MALFLSTLKQTTLHY